jgi:hypothetical protein
VIGSAGSDDKCRAIVDDHGFDACINYRTGRISSGFGSCAGRHRLFFDNGGAVDQPSAVLEVADRQLANGVVAVVCIEVDGGAVRSVTNAW